MKDKHDSEASVKAGKKAPAHVHDHGGENDRLMLIRLITGAIIFCAGLLSHHVLHFSITTELIILISAYVILGYDVVFSAIRNVLHGRFFDEQFLMSVSSICAFVIGEYPEAVAVMLFYQIGEFVQDKAVDNSKKSIAALMEIRPDSANKLIDGQIVTLPAENIRINDHIIVRPGERVPLDGVVIAGETSLDTRALTGESLPKDISVGDEILSGTINLSGAVTVRVTKTFENSTASKIIHMVRNASTRKAPTENFITGFAAVYTPIVIFMALALAIIPSLFIDGNWAKWIHRACVFLVVSCPCAFVISVPLTFFGGIGAASGKGILVKGGNYLEALNKVTAIVFDKTGTLSKGVFRVTGLIPANGVSKEELLEKAAAAESFSKHPIARSIAKAYGKTIDSSRITDYSEFSGNGVKASVDGELILAGNAGFMKSRGIAFDENNDIGTKIYVAHKESYMGCIIITDELKEDSRKAIDELRRLGIKNMVMLTGDNKRIAENAAGKLGLEKFYAELLPGDKVRILEEIDKNIGPGGKLAFVGDGINDAPVLARADIGISMGNVGSDAAIEAADIVLMTDELTGIVDAVKIARKTKRVVIQNIVFALVVKIILLTLGAFGLAGMWEAVFGDVGVTLIAIANSLRMSR